MTRGQSICFIGLVLLLFLVSASYTYMTKSVVVFTVNRTERVSQGSGDNITHKYLIFTESETFENTDCLWYLKFDSSDLYGRIAVGGTYQAEVYGMRIPYLSAYRNIIRIGHFQSDTVAVE